MAAEPVEADAGDAKVWETEAEADIAFELRFSGPILSQDEIETLLGLAHGDEALVWRSGVCAIVDSTCAPYERLPKLEIVLGRLARLMTTSLRSFTSDDVDVSIDEIVSISFGDYLDAVPLRAIVGVLRAGRIDNFGLVTVDDGLIHSVVNVFRGGAPSREEGKPYTAIERTLVTRMIEVVLADAREAFSPLTEADFQLDRIETDPRFAAMASPGDAAIVVKLRIGMEDRGGRLELVLPNSAIEPIREDCRRRAPGLSARSG